MSEASYFAAAKLLLFGEYLVLRGSKSIAIPLQMGQRMSVRRGTFSNILWEAFQGRERWLQVELDPDLQIIQSSKEDAGVQVQRLLRLIKNASKSSDLSGLHFLFHFDFDRNYGLGTSSTLISLLSQWSGVDPYELLAQSFGGSGYDIAAATADGPILFIRAEEGRPPAISPINLQESITEKLIFVYTGRKQNSAEQVSFFRSVSTTDEDIRTMNDIVDAVQRCSEIENLERLMEDSETLLGRLLQAEKIKDKLFGDYPYAIKSLGAWGGDFVMATTRGNEVAKQYFTSKGMYPIFSYSELIKK